MSLAIDIIMVHIRLLHNAVNYKKIIVIDCEIVYIQSLPSVL